MDPEIVHVTDWATPAAILTLLAMIGSGIAYLCREAQGYLARRTTEEREDRRNQAAAQKADQDRFLTYLLAQIQQASEERRNHMILIEAFRNDIREHTEYSKQHHRQHLDDNQQRNEDMQELKAVLYQIRQAHQQNRP